MNFQRHTYHLVNPSPWPLIASSGAFCLTTGAVMYFHYFMLGSLILTIGVFLILFTMRMWWKDVIRESTFEGHHTILVQQGLRYGVILFIVSEVMFFFAFFWAFFHSSLAPSIELGSVWPPVGITVFSPWSVPLLNTVILLISGITVTWAHHALCIGVKEQLMYSLILTVFLAFIFLLLQLFEYFEASFDISDSVYGSTFYLATGFHGLHVLIGSVFLIVNVFRCYENHYTQEHHLGFWAAVWYWHFVDVVWLILFLSLYYWGNKSLILI